MAFRLCWATRIWRVLRPRSNNHAIWGSGAGPYSFIMLRTRSMSSLDPETTPATRSECPPRYLVALWITAPTPKSAKRMFTGEAKVASTASRISRSRAISTGTRGSKTRSVGLVGTSRRRTPVWGVEAPSQSSLFSGIDQGGRDAASRQLVFEERPRCPVEVSGRDDVSPVGKGGENRHRDRRHTARKEQPCLRPLESGHLLAYERLIRIVAVPGIEKLGKPAHRPLRKT